MRDALSILDKIISFTEGKITRDEVSKNLNILDTETYFLITSLINENNIAQILIEFDKLVNKGYDTKYFLDGFANHIRELILCKDPKSINLIELNNETKKSYLIQSKVFEINWLIEALNIIKIAEINHKASVNKRLNSELCLMQLASLQINGEKKIK